jgi:TolB-like protein
VLAGAVFAAIYFLGGTKAAPSRIGTDSDPNHIAVLYFDARSEGDKLGFLADGLTEALIDELSAVKQLKVISRNGVAPFKGKTVAPDSIQRALKVGTVVTGTVTQLGDSLRVSVDLNDALTGNQIGKKKTITRARADVFKLQDDLAKEVALSLRSTLGHEVEAVGGHPGTSNAQAWEALQRAKQTLAGVDTILRSGDVQGAVRRLAAVDSELIAVRSMDNKWAAPVVARGWIPHRKVLMLGFGEPAQIPKWLDQAGKLGDTAVFLAPTDPDALELRATIRFFRWLYNPGMDVASASKLLNDAEADYRAALKANPLQASAWNALSYLLIGKNQYTEAKLAAQSAYESDPYLRDVDRTIWRLFVTSLDLNAPKEADNWCNVGRQRMPTNFRFTECRLWLFSVQGQKPNVDSLWSTYRDFVKLSPAGRRQLDSLRGGMLVGFGLFRAGLADSARAVVTRSRGNPQVDPAAELVELEARFRAQVGDKDDAIRLLGRWLASNPQGRAYASADERWWWDPVRDDPRYKALVGGGG